MLAEDRQIILKRTTNKLYALFDFELNRKRGYSFEKFIDRAYDLGVEYIQYRDKINDLSTKKRNLQKIRILWDRVLLVNDELSLVDECDGVHLGQEDLLEIDSDTSNAVKLVRGRIGDKIFGISTHNRLEVELANSLEIDYIGLGAYRDSSTKAVTNILESRVLELIPISTHPVAVIGGVRRDDQICGAEFLVIGSNFYED